MRSYAAAAAVCLLALLGAASASADRATLAASAAAPWLGGAAVVTPLEALAGRIASHIAGHAVAVRCESAETVGPAGGAADAAGMVHVLIDSRTGRYARTAGVIELGAGVCGPLQQFAQTAAKPTRCAAAGTTSLVPCFTGTPVAPGSGGPSECWGSPPSCLRVVDSSPDFWHDYNSYSAAIQTLAHEAIHTQQAQKGRPRPKGNLVEQQADCWGMQWMPWVATQLGDDGDDAQAVAMFYWLVDYPTKKTAHPGYWSAACLAGGSLDIRAGKTGAWP